MQQCNGKLMGLSVRVPLLLHASLRNVSMILFIIASISAKAQIIPVKLWDKSNSAFSTTGTLEMPSSIDSEGTITIKGSAKIEPRIAQLQKADFPSDLQFLFDKSSTLYVRVMREDVESEPVYKSEILVRPLKEVRSEIHVGPLQMSFPSSIGASTTVRNLDYFKTNYKLHIPYSKSMISPSSRQIRIVDALGNSITDITPALTLNGRFSAYSIPVGDLSLEKDNLINLPPVIDLLHSRDIPKTRLSTLYHLAVTHSRSDQTFLVSLLQNGSTSVTEIQLPIGPASSTPALDTVSAILRHSDDTPAAGTTVTLVKGEIPLATPQKSSNKSDSARVLSREVITGPQGILALAFPKSRTTTETSILATAAAPYPTLFNTSTMYLRLNSPSSQVIKFSPRLSITAQLVRKDGTLVDVEEQAYSTKWGGIYISRIGRDGKKIGTDTWGFKSRYTTGTCFIIPNIAVPGKYEIKNQGLRFGPVDIGVTSPTAIVKFKEIPD